MGRPIHKKYLGNHPGAIQVTAYRRATGVEVVGVASTYIVSQRSSDKFMIADSVGAWQEVLTLATSVQGSLLPGEFIVTSIDSLGNPSSIGRIYNRTLRSGGVKVPWDIKLSAVGGVGGIVVVGGVALVASATPHGLITGDKVVFSGVVGTTQVNGNVYTVTVTSPTTLRLSGSAVGFGVYVSGGVWRRAPLPGHMAIDIKV
jgi:hypothetical protein